MTTALIQALSRMADSRQADGTSSLVSGEDRKTIIDGCYDLMVAARQMTNPEWRAMDTAPLDGKHCIIAVQDGAFIYSVQGSFDGKRWNAVHAAGVKPLCWMPNVRLPSEFLPAAFQQAHNVAGGQP